MAKKTNKNNFRNNNYKSTTVLTCPLKGKEDQIDYKNVQLLEKYISTRGRIMPSSKTGVCSQNQRKLTEEIKKARQLALLPYTKYV